MDNAGYINLSRQSGLMRELTIIANNVANADTTGFKREGAIFSEHIQSLSGPVAEDTHSLSMGKLAGHVTDFSSGGVKQTGSQLDVALQGEGFFTIAAPQGVRLSRAGHFLVNEQGTLVTPDGMAVLDAGGGEIQVPPNADLINIGGDGTISANGLEIARFGVVTAESITLKREGDNLWDATQGFEPVENPQMLQGFLEDSNVSPVAEIARMIEVQRHYDAGMKLMELDHERISEVITTVRQLG